MSHVAWTRVAVVAISVLSLETACRAGLISPLSVIPPSEMALAFIQILTVPKVVGAIGRSLLNVGVAVAAIIAVGIIVGILLHPLKRVRRVIDPMLSSYYALPLIAFYPLLIVLFGVGRTPIILMGFITGFGAMVLATLDGLDAIPPVLSKVARMNHMGRIKTALRLQLPAAAPNILAGVRLAVAYGFIGVIASEFLLSGEGLGFEVGYAYNSFETKKMYGLILLVLVIVTILNLIVHAWDQMLRLRRRPI